MRKVVLVTGGQRSGKSSYAEKLAHQLTDRPVYIATARIWDEEFRQRVMRHRKSRGEEWTNIEEEKELGRHDVGGRVVVIDCITLWCTNFFMEQNDVSLALEAVKAEFEKFVDQDAVFIFVGIIPNSELLEGFAELEKGFVVTDNAMETSVPGLFAAGDVRTTPFRQVVTAAGDGASSAHSADEYIQNL